LGGVALPLKHAVMDTTLFFAISTIVTNVVFFFTALSVYYKRPTHLMVFYCIAMYFLVIAFSIMWHACFQFGSCVKDPAILLALDTIFSYYSVTASSITFIPSPFAERWIPLMSIFDVMVFILMADSIYAVIIIIVVNTLPVVKFGTRPKGSDKHGFLVAGVVFGILSVSCKVASDTSDISYLKYHSLFHLCSGLAAIFFVLGSPDLRNSTPVIDSALRDVDRIVKTEKDAVKRAWLSIPGPVQLIDETLNLVHHDEPATTESDLA
jgi:hypothetical protein